ncbi:MAG: hypothetical protein ACC656_15800, partial [Candidatus Heimdallarchaeota archaeon]
YEDAATKNYVDSLLSKQKYSLVNNNITALDTSSTKNIVLASTKTVLIDPVTNTNTELFISGNKALHGPNQQFFFSPNGVVVRSSNDIRIADKLYLDHTYATYDLDSNDKITFKYLIDDSSSETIILNSNDTISFFVGDDILAVEFTGIDTETATLIIDGVSFTIGNVSEQFVFDIGGTREYTFTLIGEEYLTTPPINGNSYIIRYDGIGSLLFSVNEPAAGTNGL